MKIVVFGGDGQVGKEVLQRCEQLNFEVRAPDMHEVDITDSEQVSGYLHVVAPQLVINLAAYTAVDKAEEEKDLAYQVNAEGAGVIAKVSQRMNAHLIHVSTDYVFPGTEERPLREDDAVHPVNVYGASKLEGERQVREYMNEGALIVRTSSVHGQYGHNFVHAMRDLFCSRTEVSVVQDQIMSPTWAGWLAEVLLDLARLKATGLVHACSGASISWYDFAVEIYRQLQEISWEGLHDVSIKPVSSREFPRPAKRPQYSVMDVTHLSALLGREPLDWKDGLRGHIADLVEGGEKL